MHVFFLVLIFCSFFSLVAAAAPDGGAGAAASFQALLGPLLSANVLNLSGAGSFPWHNSYAETITTTNFYFRSFLFSEIVGLVQQCRSSQFANVSSLLVTFRKIPGLDITWRAFLAADADLDPENFDSGELVDFVRTHPGAKPQFTLDKDTTQSTIEIPINWLIGLGTSVAYVQPPLRTPRLVIFLESDGTLLNKEIVFALSGTVEIAGYGYVAGHVGGKAPPLAAAAGATATGP